MSAWERPDAYEFAIADSGPGIALAYHQQIFDIFQTLQVKTDASSTGIGLAIVKKLVEVEGGRIWLVSEAGTGATFHFTWPKETSAVRAKLISDSSIEVKSGRN